MKSWSATCRPQPCPSTAALSCAGRGVQVLGQAANTLLLVLVVMLVAGLMFSIIGREFFGGASRPTHNHLGLSSRCCFPHLVR